MIYQNWLLFVFTKFSIDQIAKGRDSLFCVGTRCADMKFCTVTCSEQHQTHNGIATHNMPVLRRNLWNVLKSSMWKSG